MKIVETPTPTVAAANAAPMISRALPITTGGTAASASAWIGLIRAARPARPTVKRRITSVSGW
jgi:hypothetical protein